MAQGSGLREADPVAGQASAEPAFTMAEALPPALLYRRCDPAELPFALSRR
jgi:hypothetical protein